MGKKKKKRLVVRNPVAGVMAERGLGRQVFKDRREARAGDRNRQREFLDDADEQYDQHEHRDND